jgi:hypothetical protein
LKKKIIIILGLIIIILIAAEINSYNVSKSIAQKKICSFNIDKIYNAVELTVMEGIPIIKPVTLESLIKSKKLKELPVCPSGGKYSIKISSETEMIKVNCSIHKRDK